MPRITVGRLMLGVAGLAVILAAFRAHFSLGSLVFGLLSVGIVRAHRYAVAERAQGRVVSRLDLARAFGASFGFTVGRMLTLAVATVVAFFVVSPDLLYLTADGRRLSTRLSDARVVGDTIAGTVVGWLILRAALSTIRRMSGPTREEGAGAGDASTR